MDSNRCIVIKSKFWHACFAAFSGVVLSIPIALATTDDQGTSINRKAVVKQYSSRPVFDQLALSPDGSRVAVVARTKDDVTSLLVLDVSGEQTLSLFRVSVPLMVGVQDYGWVNNDELVALITARDPNPDSSSSSSSSSSSGASYGTGISESTERSEYYTYVAHIDVKAKKIKPRIRLVQPTESELVRAPLSDNQHVILKECFGRMTVPDKDRASSQDSSSSSSDDSGLGGADTTNTTAYCQLKSWNPSHLATQITPAVYGNLLKFYISDDGKSAHLHGRQLDGDIVVGSWQDNGKWEFHPVTAADSLPPEYDSSEEDNPKLWAAFHKALPEAGEPAGDIIFTSGSHQPIAIQEELPQRHIVLFDNTLATPVAAISNAFPNGIVQLTSVSEDKNAILFKVSSRTDPGSYYVWRRSDNQVLMIGKTNAVPSMQPAQTHFELGWYGADGQAAVTRPAASQRQRGIVIVPALISDDALGAAFSYYEAELQWLVANGLTVVQIPVGVPANLDASQRGAAWRQAVGKRIAEATARAKLDSAYKPDRTLCLYGRESAGYAALAASTFQGTPTCVVTINTPTDPTMMVKPYALVTTVNGSFYLNRSNLALQTWRTLFGDDLATADPSSWTYRPDTQVLLAYQMYDSSFRPLAGMTSDVRRAIRKSDGSAQLYNALTYTRDIDLWNSRMFLTIADFLVSPENRKSRKGIIEVSDLDANEKASLKKSTNSKH